MNRVALIALSLIAGCSLDSRARVRVGDATLAPPTKWRATPQHGALTLVDPDRQMRVTVIAVEGIGAGDPKAAISTAWQRVNPGFALAFAEPPDEPPPRGGWDAILSARYAMPAASNRAVRAEWRRWGTRAWIVLIDGDRNAIERRNAQLETLLGSLHPAAMHDEKIVGAPRALDTAALDAFTSEALTTLAVPGAAVAVIVDGRVVYERTMGVRTVGQPAPISLNTRFLIASITKSMTTFMQATLVDAGVLRWDTPVTTLLPTFALADAELTRALLLWHMSCACTGMPRQDLEGLFEWDGVTPEMRLAAMRSMRPTTKLGETFQYSNPMVSAGGFAAAHAFAPTRSLADAYAAAMQTKIFDPIGMTSTTLDPATVANGEHARPHALAIDGSTRAMPLSIERQVGPIAPAAAVWTTLRDMERYLLTELALGVAPDGKRVVSAENIRERYKLRVRSDENGGYGLGLDVTTYAGARVLSHDGGSFGFGTTMFWLPDQRVGIVILTNVRNGNAKEQLPFNAAVTRRIVELLFAEARPRASIDLAYFASLRKATPYVPAADRAWESALVGTYHHDALGTLTIRQTATGAELDVGEWKTAIDRKVDADGTAQLILLEPPLAGGTMLIVPGTPPAIRIPGQTSYTFTRVP